MTNIYSASGLLVALLLLICTAAYLHQVPRLREWLFAEKKGVQGALYKASVIGRRLHMPVALLCFATAAGLLFFQS